MNERELPRGPRIVVIGGGTGSFTLLKDLKRYVQDLTALVNMADDGGSTGQLRDELGALPPGDVRQCLVALSNSPRVRDLFNYRFEEGTLAGHAFGNLLLSALEKMTGSFAEAVEGAGEILAITGRVLPMTLDDVHLELVAPDGTVTSSQFVIQDMDFAGVRPQLRLSPPARLNPSAKQAIMQASLIVIAPGNLYTSLAPALLVDGVGEALAAATARKVYVCNLVTKPGQTDGMTVSDYAAEIERFMNGPKLDYVIYNNVKPNPDLIDKYAHDGEYPVEWDDATLTKAHYRAKGLDLVAREIWQGASAGDPIAATRTFIRHDADKVARELMKTYFD